MDNVPLPKVDPPITSAALLVIETLFAPLFESDTAPVKLLLDPFVVKSIVNPPVLKLDVPGIVNALVCEIGPPAVNVIAGNEIPAMGKLTVKFVDVPVMAPPKVINPPPLPPIVDVLKSVIALFKVRPDADNVNAPLLTPEPFNFIALVLAKMPLLLLKFISSVAPDETVVLLVLPKLEAFSILNVPAL